MPEVRIRPTQPRKEQALTIISEKGGIYLTQAEVEYVRFVEKEFVKIQYFLKNKLFLNPHK